MKLYKVEREGNTGYDEFIDFIVAAENVEQARMTHPSGEYTWDSERYLWSSEEEGLDYNTWVSPDKVTVDCIGEALPHIEAGVIMSSFNAG